MRTMAAQNSKVWEPHVVSAREKPDVSSLGRRDGRGLAQLSPDRSSTIDGRQRLVQHVHAADHLVCHLHALRQSERQRDLW